MKPHILHLDTDSECTIGLAVKLCGLGLLLDHTSSAKEAIGLIMDRKYDLLICEILLEGTSGADFIKGALAMNPSLEVIVLIHSGEIKHMEEAFCAGAKEYLVKGLNNGRIMELVSGLDPSGYNYRTR